MHPIAQDDRRGYQDIGAEITLKASMTPPMMSPRDGGTSPRIHVRLLEGPQARSTIIERQMHETFT